MSRHAVADIPTRGARARETNALGSRRALSLLLLVGTGVWSAVMIATRLGNVSAPFSPRALDALLVGVPVGLALVWALSARPVGPAWRSATGLTGVVAVMLLLTPKMLTNPAIVAAIPGVIAVAWVLARRPALGVLLILTITASYGSIAAYLAWPYNRTMLVTLIGLALAGVARVVLERRDRALQVPLGVLLALGYLALTLAELLTSEDTHLAAASIQLAPLYMTSMFVVAYSQWSSETHMRIVRGLVVIALCVGAYAVLRLIVGPSHAERELASRASFFSTFNFINGKLKLLGSFPNGADLSAWTALMIPFCISCALGLRGRFQTLALVAMPLLAVALFGAQSRSAAIAAIVATLVTVLLHSTTRALPGGVRLGQTLIAIAASLAIVVGSYTLAGTSTANTGHSYLGLFNGPSQDASFAQHVYKWKEAFRDLGGHPFGYGLGTAPSANVSSVTTQFYLPVSNLGVDNGYLKIALEQGFTVMVVFALALVLLAGGLARKGVATPDANRATIGLGAAGSAVALIVLEGAGATADILPALACWIVIGLGLAQFVQPGAKRT
jgi:hypothetical protein